MAPYSCYLRGHKKMTRGRFRGCWNEWEEVPRCQMTRFVATFRNIQPGGLFLESDECFERVLQTLYAVGWRLVRRGQQVDLQPSKCTWRQSRSTSVHKCGEDLWTEVLHLFLLLYNSAVWPHSRSQWVPWDLTNRGSAFTFF